MGSCLANLCSACSSKLRSSSHSSSRPTKPVFHPVRKVSNFRERLSSTTNTRSALPEMTSTPSKASQEGSPTGFVNAVYYPNWRVYEGQTPASLNLDNVSHVFYAFARLDGDGSVISNDEHADFEIPVDGTNGCIESFRKLRRDKYPTLKLVLSLGGETGSAIFNEITLDEVRLGRLVQTAHMLVDCLAMDGLDIDWEHPANEAQSHQYTNLLARLRAAMPSPKYTLTTAVPAGIWALQHMNLGEASKHVDMINLMAYDFVGPFPGVTESGHHAQLRCRDGDNENFSVAAQTSGEAAIKFLCAQGVERKKIVLGIPLYGRSFVGATGHGQPFSEHGGQEGGIFEYRHLPISTSNRGQKHGESESESEDVDAITPCAEQFDSRLVAAWCVGPQTKEGGGFITYDNAMSVEAKAEFVKEEGLAGLFYWHVGYDKPKGKGSLVEVGARVLGVEQKRSGGGISRACQGRF